MGAVQRLALETDEALDVARDGTRSPETTAPPDRAPRLGSTPDRGAADPVADLGAWHREIREEVAGARAACGWVEVDVRCEGGVCAWTDAEPTSTPLDRAWSIARSPGQLPGLIAMWTGAIPLDQTPCARSLTPLFGRIIGVDSAAGRCWFLARDAPDARALVRHRDAWDAATRLCEAVGPASMMAP